MTRILRAIRRAQSLIALHGVAKASTLVLRRAIKGMRGRLELERRQWIHPFDTSHSVDTSGMVEAVDLSSGHKHDVYALAYYGIAPSTFRHIFNYWAQTLPENMHLADYTFVDLGAGKGRAVLLASELPFREVIGVELNPDLVSIASRNIEIWRGGGRGTDAMRVIQRDATEFSWPPSPLVVYIFNPFGPKVLEGVLENLISSFGECPRVIDVLYVIPVYEQSVERYPEVKPIWSRSFDLSAEDQAVDAFRNKSLTCNAYRIAAPGV